MEFINYEADGAVAVLTINRPKALNALNSAVLDEINEALDRCGKRFCARRWL